MFFKLPERKKGTKGQRILQVFKRGTYLKNAKKTRNSSEAERKGKKKKKKLFVLPLYFSSLKRITDLHAFILMRSRMVNTLLNLYFWKQPLNHEHVAVGKWKLSSFFSFFFVLIITRSFTFYADVFLRK